MNNVVTSVAIKLYQNAKEAIRDGFFYRKPVYNPISLEKVIVVEEGTVGGNPTVDFILQDENGQKYVFMITSYLLNTIASMGVKK